MKVAIVGTRDWPNPEEVVSFVSRLKWDTTVISGGACGVDTIAATAAVKRGLQIKIFTADWDTYGRAAGPIRNKEIVDAADGVIAFWDGVSRGTLSTIEFAKAAGKPVIVYRPGECK